MSSLESVSAPVTPPPSMRLDHLRALEAVVRTMRNDEFVRQLRGCQTREEIWALLESAAPGW